MNRKTVCTVVHLAVVLLFSSAATRGVSALQSASFEVGPRVAQGSPGENVFIPFVLTGSDTIGGWSLTMEYDTSTGAVVDVQLPDSLLGLDPDGDTLRWYYASWYGHPEWQPDYIALSLNHGGYADRFMVVGLSDMPPAGTPGVPPGENSLLFGLGFNVDPSWNGEPILLSFLTEDCADNTFSDQTGLTLWGPDTASADPATCPPRTFDLRAIRLSDGPAIEPISAQFVRADANSDMTVEMADVIFTMRFLYVPGSDAPTCMDAADSDDGGSVEMSDATYILKYLYVPGAPPPPYPGPVSCGPDPTEDGMGCDDHPCSSRR